MKLSESHLFVRYVFSWLLLLCGSFLFPQEPEDSVQLYTELFQAGQGVGETNKTGPSCKAYRTVIYFGFDKALIESSCMSNKEAFLLLDSVFSPHKSLYIDSIRITAFASPVGTHEYNLRLSERRASAIKSYLTRKYPYINQQWIRKEIAGADWRGLRSMIENDPGVPMKPELLSLFELSGDYQQLEDRIKHLDNGNVQQYINSHYYPYLQRAVTMVVFRKDFIIEKETVPEQITGRPVDRIKSPPSPVPGLIKVPTAGGGQPQDSYRRLLFAVKTNLLYDVALTPNIGVEIPIRQKWSVNAAFMRGWWLKKDDTFCWQLEGGELEGRYWFRDHGESKVLTGWFAGVFSGAGFYDFQLKRDEGYQGEFFMAGLSGGYSLPIARTWNLEFVLGAGYFSTGYRHYHVVDDLLFRQRTYRYRGFLPLKAGISLVKVFNLNLKKGGAR